MAVKMGQLPPPHGLITKIKLAAGCGRRHTLEVIACFAGGRRLDGDIRLPGRVVTFMGPLQFINPEDASTIAVIGWEQVQGPGPS